MLSLLEFELEFSTKNYWITFIGNFEKNKKYTSTFIFFLVSFFTIVFFFDLFLFYHVLLEVVMNIARFRFLKFLEITSWLPRLKHKFKSCIAVLNWDKNCHANETTKRWPYRRVKWKSKHCLIAKVQTLQILWWKANQQN